MSMASDDRITNLSLFTELRVKFGIEEAFFRYIFSDSLLAVELKNIASAPVGYLNTMYPTNFKVSSNV